MEQVLWGIVGFVGIREISEGMMGVENVTPLL